MENQTNHDATRPATLRDALAYVTEYLLYDHPKTFNLELQNPPRPNHLLQAVTLIQDWLGSRESQRATDSADETGARDFAVEPSEVSYAMPHHVLEALLCFFDHALGNDELCDCIGIYAGGPVHDALLITVAAWVREQACKS